MPPAVDDIRTAHDHAIDEPGAAGENIVVEPAVTRPGGKIGIGRVKHDDVGAMTGRQRADAPAEGACAAGQRTLVKPPAGGFALALCEEIAVAGIGAGDVARLKEQLRIAYENLDRLEAALAAASSRPRQATPRTQPRARARSA